MEQSGQLRKAPKLVKGAANELEVRDRDPRDIYREWPRKVFHGESGRTMEKPIMVSQGTPGEAREGLTVPMRTGPRKIPWGWGPGRMPALLDEKFKEE